MNIPGKAKVILAAFLAAFLAGCGTFTSLSAIHSPLYRPEVHLTTITATAENGQDKIANIRIYVIIGEMTACSGYVPSLIPCRTGAVAMFHDCAFANQSPASCTYSFEVADRRLITYQVEARTGTGAVASTQPITYAGGASITTAKIDFAAQSLTIPWEVARPIWWQTGPPGGNSPSHMDVGFFPDSEMSDYRSFADSIEPIILGAHFDSNRPFSRFYSLNRNALFNLWAGPAGGESEPQCVRSLSGFAEMVGSAIDGQVIAHTSPYGDCSDIALGGLGTVNVQDPTPDRLYLHESGHFLIGLADEYCCTGGYGTASTPANVFGSQAACQATATAIGVDPAFCVQIGVTGNWHMDDGQQSIMNDNGPDATWRTASGKALENRLVACVNGNC